HDGVEQLGSLRRGLVHFPVAGDNSLSDSLVHGMIRPFSFIRWISKNTGAEETPCSRFKVNYFSLRQAMPGSSRPSRNSREAPPPVEMWVILSAKPSFSTAAAESPPPMMEIALLSATACATAMVPFAKFSHSETPIGPFQTTVPALATASAKSARVFGPMSRPIQPSGISSESTIRSEEHTS